MFGETSKNIKINSKNSIGIRGGAYNVDPNDNSHSSANMEDNIFRDVASGNITPNY